MPAQSANEKNPLDEVIDVLEPHAGVVRLSAAVFAFLFVGFAIFYSNNVAASLLPPWTNSINIGSATGGSDYVLTSSDFDVNANGSDIWGASDSFRFGYQNVPAGDFEIVTKVTYLKNTDSWAKAGLMIRASAAANSPHLFVFTTPGSNGVNFQGRASAGASSQQYANAPATAFPKWLKIKRVGGNYTVYYSTNGTSYTQLGPSKTLNAAAPLVGVAVTSHVSGVLTKASFKETKVTSLAAPVSVTPVVPSVKTFTVSSPTYLGGGTSVIWDATGVSSCSILSSPNIWGGSVGTTGSKLVFPTQATSFTLTCFNANGLAVTLPLTRTTTVKPACSSTDVNAPIINSHLYQISGQTQTYIIQNCAKRLVNLSTNVCRYDAAKVEHPLSGYLNNVSRGADATSASDCPNGPMLPPPCSGTPILGLNGSESNIAVDVGAQVTVNVRGLSNCTSADTAYISTNSTPGSTWNPDGQWLTSCTLSNGSTCSIVVTLPSSFTPGGPYSARIRLDRGTNGSIDTTSSNIVTINVNAPPVPQPQPGPSQSKICPNDCSPDAVIAYAASRDRYVDALLVMLAVESGGSWDSFARYGSSVCPNAACYGALQFTMDTWNGANSSYYGFSNAATWSANDVYRRSDSARWTAATDYSFVPWLWGSESPGNDMVDHNIWNPFGQIDATLAYLDKGECFRWPWWRSTQTYDKFPDTCKH